MAVHLDQEAQVELIKKFWKQYGFTIILAIILVAVGIGGWRFWQSQHKNKIYEASKLYQMVVYDFANEHETLALGKVKTLTAQFPSSVYSSLGMLYKAKYLVQQKQYQSAADDLQWVVAHSKAPAVSAIATIRLARLLLQLNQPDAALQALEHQDETFSAGNQFVKGQAYLMLGDTQKAKVAMQQALENMGSQEPLYQDLQFQLYALPAGKAK